MTTMPTRLAKVSHVCKTLEEARTASIQAYRQWYRSAPEIVSLFALPVPPSMVRLKIRHDFERNRHVKDLKMINVLLLKNQQEYQETMNVWKQEAHVLNWFKQYEEEPAPTTFLDKFYSGRDDPLQIANPTKSTG